MVLGKIAFPILWQHVEAFLQFKKILVIYSADLSIKWQTGL